MKNRIFISFLINILIGILFSFPVFSMNLNVQANSISKFEKRICENDIIVKNVSDNIYSYNTSIIFPKVSENNFIKTKRVKKGSSPGNRDKTKINSALPEFRKSLSTGILPCISNLNPTFVNLSYLKYLRITKMLC